MGTLVICEFRSNSVLQSLFHLESFVDRLETRVEYKEAKFSKYLLAVFKGLRDCNEYETIYNLKKIKKRLGELIR